MARIYKKVTPREFIYTWQTSQYVDEVMEKLDMSRAAVHSRTGFYRKRGIPMKKMSRRRDGRIPMNIDELASYAASLVESEGNEKD